MKEKLPYNPKAFFQRVLEEHANWLFTQGYHERSLGLRDTPGRLAKDLKEQLGAAILQTLWEYREEEFQLGTRGVFGRQKDPVEFKFHYKYDPNTTKLFLTKLDASLYDREIQYLINNNDRRQLPTADAVHQQLSAVIAKGILESLKQQDQPKKKNHRPR